MCLDAGAEFSDFSIGDPWIRDEKGHWKYDEPGGWSSIIVRTPAGRGLAARRGAGREAGHEAHPAGRSRARPARDDDREEAAHGLPAPAPKTFGGRSRTIPCRSLKTSTAQKRKEMAFWFTRVHPGVPASGQTGAADRPLAHRRLLRPPPYEGPPARRRQREVPDQHLRFRRRPGEEVIGRDGGAAPPRDMAGRGRPASGVSRPRRAPETDLLHADALHRADFQAGVAADAILLVNPVCRSRASPARMCSSRRSHPVMRPARLSAARATLTMQSGRGLTSTHWSQ